MDELEKFIIKAKANGWVRAELGGKQTPSSRLGSLDITFEEGPFFYQDSFVGLSDFCGQEHVCKNGEPVWSMAYYGYLLCPEIFSSQQVIEILRPALGALYRENRFLGDFVYRVGNSEYRDLNRGDWKRFEGTESILDRGRLVYELKYFGGLVY